MFNWTPNETLIEGVGTCSPRMVRSEVDETRSNYQKCHLWWFRNLACDDSIETGLKKTGLVYLLDLFGERREEGCVISCTSSVFKW